ncbi:polyprotein [Macrosiphum euphorbiae virus 1]|uniref:polyprotein n=1 Tax=Macrosiphum euphorbiae virus 1 TaxID=1685953 RepID=UPI0006EC0594|nr:polyprotein [Macrosiphum euphorbiae virus 1]ALK01984.1 polyprotein [Macrosiphum euphorbiae virus 1]
MSGAWSLVKRAVKAPKPAPKKGKFGTSFNRGTIAAGLAAWGTECSLKVVKTAKPAPAPVAPWATEKHRAALAARRAATAAKTAALPAAAVVAVKAKRTTKRVVKKEVDPAPPSPITTAQKAVKRVRRPAQNNIPDSIRKAVAKATKPVPFGATFAGISGTPSSHVEEPNVELAPANAPAEKVSPGLFIVLEGDVRDTLLRQEYVFAHCTSRDWAEPKRSSAGVAKVVLEASGFDKPMPLDLVDDTSVTHQQSGDKHLYTLLTKEEYCGKPTYGSFTNAVTSLRRSLLVEKLSEVTMPLIGCGRDRLPLEFVLFTIREELVNYGINVCIIDNDTPMVDATRNIVRAQRKRKVDSKWTHALQNGLREFTERVAQPYEPERKLARRLYTNDRVLAEYTCSSQGGGSLTISVADIRHAIRDPATSVAIATSKDWNNPYRGVMAPASYVYAECGYPKPSQDDLVNSRLAHQKIGEKSIFTLFPKDREGAYPKLVDYRRSLLELALGLDLIGEDHITMPALCMDRDRVQYESGLNSVLELLCERGINVRICTTSKSQFFTMKSLLSKYGSDAEVVATDNSTPNHWVPRAGDVHNHKCYSCGIVYSHWHKFHNLDHPQFDKQCPNEECAEYHCGKNPTNSQLVFAPVQKLELNTNIELLQDPTWLREASVFPAAIETVWESVAKYLPETAKSLFPKVIPDNSKEEVIQLRRLGYAGAVDSKVKPVKVWTHSQLIGLAEVKPQAPKPVKVKKQAEPIRYKYHCTTPQQPISPGWCRRLKPEQDSAWMSLGGWSSSYEGTHYRSEGTRSNHKTWAGHSSDYLRYGWVPAKGHGFASSRGGSRAFGVLPIAKCVERVERSKYEAVDDSPSVPIRRLKAQKPILSDEYWMEHFKTLNVGVEPNISYAQAKKDVKRTRVATAHLVKGEVAHSRPDLVGPVEGLAKVTGKISIFNFATKVRISRYLNDAEDNMVVSSKCGDKHVVGEVRTFGSSTRLASGSPIYNAVGRVCSLVTYSDGNGRYAVAAECTPSKTYVCSGLGCQYCKVESLLEKHSGKGKKKRPNKNKGGSSSLAVMQKNMNQAAKEAAELTQLKLRAEKQQQDVAEITQRMSQLKANSTAIKQGADKLAQGTGVSTIKLKPASKQGRRKAKPTTGSYSLSSLMIVGSLLLFSLMGAAFGQCFRGFIGSRFISGEVVCGLDESLSDSNYLYTTLSENTRNCLQTNNTVLREWYRVSNKLVDVMQPCHVSIDKELHTFAINDYMRVYTEPEHDYYVPLAILLVLTLLGLAVNTSCRKNRRVKVVSSYRPVVYSPIVKASIVALCIVAINAVTPVEKKPIDIVNDAKAEFDIIATWFDTHKMTAAALKEKAVVLGNINDKLEKWAQKGDTVASRVSNLLNDWNAKVASLDNYIRNVNTLTDEIKVLKERLVELEKANKNAKAAFEEFKTRFSRSAELEEHDDPEQMSEEELIAVQANLKARKDDIISALAEYEESEVKRERNARQFSSVDVPRDTQTKNKHRSLLQGYDSNTPSQEVLPIPAAQTTENKPASPSSSSESNSSEDDKGEALFCWRTESSKFPTVPESDIKVKFGVNGDVACDANHFKWCLYKNWKECQDHGSQNSAIGLGWQECAIGRFVFNDRYYVAKKNDGDVSLRKLCTASCFALNDIYRAIRHNEANGYCVWPLIYSGHWDVSAVIDNATEVAEKFKGLTILSSKLVIINSDDTIELTLLTRDAVYECCNGFLAKTLGAKLSFYDGPCLCVANSATVEKRIKDALVEKYSNLYKLRGYLSLKTVGSVALITAAAIVSPFFGLAAAMVVFATNAYADCSLKNFHTLYVGDSNSKQIYTSLYMEKGDCFTLGESTYELIDIDDTYDYKQTEKFPSSFTSLCTDMDWGCGLADGSKICEEFNKDCKNKCDKTAGAIYRQHCIATTTFHGDGCYGFLVQDHSVSVHGGICLLTNASKAYTGYSQFSKSESRKLKFRVSSFDQSKEFTINLADMIYSDSGFTIQDMKIQRDRIPIHILEAGQVLCSYTDNSGNDFCHTVTDDTSKLTNQGCVNLDWTFLADDKKWKIDDTSSIITPYVYDLYEVCEFDNMSKNGKVISVTPTGMVVSLKIDSDYKCSAFTTTRCRGVKIISIDTSPGFVELVQATWVKVQISSETDCYVSLKTSACSFISHNFCKVTKDSVVCRWVIYCPTIMDVTATIIGEGDIDSFNFTSGKQSFPTWEYGRTAYTTGAETTSSAVSSILTSATKVLSWVPGYDLISRLLNLSMSKIVVPLVIGLSFFLCMQIHSIEGMVISGIVAWLYFFTGLVSAGEGEAGDEEFRFWHLLLILALASVNWIKLLSITYTMLCRRCSGLWHKYNLSNPVVGMPAVDWCLWFLSILLLPTIRLVVLVSSSMTDLVEVCYKSFKRPQSTLFNSEELNHSPVAYTLCKYVSRASYSVDLHPAGVLAEVWGNSTSALTISPKTSFTSEIGCRLFNSPPSDGDQEDMTVEYGDKASSSESSNNDFPADATYVVEDWTDDEHFEDASSHSDSSELNAMLEFAAKAAALKPVIKPYDHKIEALKKICFEDVVAAADLSDDSEDSELENVRREYSDEYVDELLREIKMAHMASGAIFDEPPLVLSAAAPKGKPSKNRTRRSPQQERERRHKKRKLEKGQPTPVDPDNVVSIVIPKVIWKHAASITMELVKHGRNAAEGVDPSFDTHIIRLPAEIPAGRVIFVTVKHNDSHSAMLNLTPDGLKRHNKEYEASCPKGAEKIELPNTQLESTVTTVVKSVVPDYTFKHYGCDLKRYFICVPTCLGFESLRESDLPGFVIMPSEVDTIEGMRQHVRSEPTTTIIIVSNRVIIPSNWTHIVTVFVRDMQLMRKVMYTTKNMLEYEPIKKRAEELKKDKAAVSVKDIPSLVSAVFSIGMTCKRRHEDVLEIRKPPMFTVKELVNSMDSVSVHCLFYAGRVADGDFIKLSVAKFAISVYKDGVRNFLNGSNRTFLAFRHKVLGGESNTLDMGQLKSVWPIIKKTKIPTEDYSTKVDFGDRGNSIYIATHRHGAFDGLSFEYIDKAIKQCGMNAEIDQIEHIYVLLPDDKGRKMTNTICKALVRDIVNRGIEVTILIGSNNDMKSVVKHAHVSLMVLAGGETIKIDSSINVEEENVRKDQVSKATALEIERAPKLEASPTISFYYKEENEDYILYFKKGFVDQEGWWQIDLEVTFQSLVQTLYRKPVFQKDRRRQIWLLSIDQGKIAGLLPSESVRPKHFGIHFMGSRYFGVDAVGPDNKCPIYAPVCGADDKGRRCTYRTYPLVQHDGGTATGIYTTEIAKKIGKAFVFSKNRLMSGCQVYIVPPNYENRYRETLHSLSSGIITTCSKFVLLGVEGFIHPLHDLSKLAKTTDIPSRLNARLRISLQQGKIEDCFASTFNPNNVNLTVIGTIPSCEADDLITNTVEIVKPGSELDPLTGAPNVELSNEDDDQEKPWWLESADYCFIEAWSDDKYPNTVPPTLGSLVAPWHYGPHVCCPTQNYSARDYPCPEKKFKSAQALQYHSNIGKAKVFCSPVCALHYNLVTMTRSNYMYMEFLSLMFDKDETINSLTRFAIWKPTIVITSLPCLPELTRLQRAMEQSDFSRVKWYDNLLDAGEADNVFINYQLENRKRFARFDKELTAMCSANFDFPTNHNGSIWTPPHLYIRTIITMGIQRTSSMGIKVTTKHGDTCPSKPLRICPSLDVDRKPDLRAYVQIRRACVLLLAEGWNYFDVYLDECIDWDPCKVGNSIIFSNEIFGVHCINVVTVSEKLHRGLSNIPQLLENCNLVPPQLANASPFLWRRGVKTAAIVNSINEWSNCQPASWESIDVARSGLSKTECPDVIVSSENKPAFMNDNSFAIWTISNGIKTGSCYSSGIDMVGANHCTLGNTICLETPAPYGNSFGVKRANYVSKIVKSFEAGDMDLHNSTFVFAEAKKGEIYATLNPAQKRGRWLMCTAVAEFEPTMQSTFNKFVPVNINFADRTVEVAPYKLYKGLSGSPIISSKGAVVGTYGLSTNVHYQDTSLTGVGRDTTLCHSMVADNTSESEGYFVQAAKELCEMEPHINRKCFLEAPTGTGKSTLFPLAVLNTIVKNSRVTEYNVCMLEPTRAAVHNCYERVISLLDKQSDRWNRIYTVRLATGKRGQTEGEHHKSKGNGKIQLCVMTYGRFIAEYRSQSEVPHNYQMLLMDEIHTRSKDVDVATAYLLSGDTRCGDVKICYMTATSVGRVCEVRLCEGRDLQGTRFKITEEFLIETRKEGKKAEEPGVVADNAYFTVDLKAAKLNLKTRAQYVSWPRSAMEGGRCLVFLPSRNDCEKFVSWCRQNYSSEKESFVSLHAGSSVKDLANLPPTAIIGCTDFASTAITVPNCNCVVDFMEDWTPMITLFANDEGFNYRNVITKEVVSKQVSTQRKGRTGRTCNGTYFSCASIHTIEETKLSESMHAQIYFNLLIKMGRPKALRGFIMDNPEFERIYEHDWLEPEELSIRYTNKRDKWTNDPHRTAFNRFCVKMTNKLEIIREWEKDQLWWYLATCVGQDYLDFCFATENISTHGFGVSNVKVTKLVNDCWLVVPTETEAHKVREDLLFKVDSYAEDMSNFDNYVQRVHDVAGSVSLHTLAKRIEKTSPGMLKSIDPSVLKFKSDAKENVAVESTERNEESLIGISFGAVAAAGAIGALCSAGLFAFNHRADWSALEVHAVEKSELASATYHSMIKYCNHIAAGKPLDDEPTISAVSELIEWVEKKWKSLSDFFKNLLKGLISFRETPDTNLESSDVILEAILKNLNICKAWLVGFVIKYGYINVGATVASFGIGAMYNKMCDTFGVIFTNAILALVLAASSCFLGSTQTAINAVTLIISYISNGLISGKNTLYTNNATRAGALLLTAGGGAALSLLLKGAALSKPLMCGAMSSGPNVTTGLLAMINPYNTGVSHVSDGIIIAKMVASLCKQDQWGKIDLMAVGSTLMSMLFRADAMTCMVSLTAGLFLGFAKIYMSRTEFWFKVVSATNIKNADGYRDIMDEQTKRFEKVFDTILFSAGIIANPMSLVSIVCNIISDVAVAHMQNDGSDVQYTDIVRNAAVYHSGVSMIYGMSCAVFKICRQLKNTVTKDWNNESEVSWTSILSQLSELCSGFTFDCLWDKSLNIARESCNGISFDFMNMDTIKGMLYEMWDFIKGLFMSCYNWCKEKIDVWMARTTDKFSNAIKAAMPFASTKDPKVGRTNYKMDSRPPLKTAYWMRAAIAFKSTFSSKLEVEQIMSDMQNRTGCNEESIFEGLTHQHHFMCGLIGWAMEKYSIDAVAFMNQCPKLFGLHHSDRFYDSKFFNFNVHLIQFVSKVTGKDIDTVVSESGGRFVFVAGSDSVSGIEDLYDRVPLAEDLNIKPMMTMNGDSKPPSSINSQDPEGVITDLDHMLGQISGASYDYTWLDDLSLFPEKKDDYENYIGVDTRFWYKERLQDTGDRNIIPLFVQSVSEANVANGSIPNIICDLGSSIYVKEDLSLGSGDYIYGELKRPWDVMRMDSVSLCKLLSLIGDVSDHGTHVTMKIGMSDKTVIQMSISHSYTSNVANTGLLCQQQDSETKLVVRDIAAVEIMSWASPEGFKMIATCPPSTAGAWDLLYDNILKYLPFFRDIVTRKITAVDAKSLFDDWAILAAPTCDTENFSEFISWKTEFAKRRFAPASIFSSVKSSVVRNVSRLASTYNKSMAESREINEQLSNPNNYGMIKEKVGYSSYYGDFAEAIHSRVGKVYCNTFELPWGIEDVRISLDDYALGCWFRKLVTASSVEEFGCSRFDVNGVRVNPHRNLHHPAAFYPVTSIVDVVDMKYLTDAKSRLVRHGYKCGYNVIIATVSGTEISYEMSGAAGTCRCTVIYLVDGFKLISAVAYRCLDGENCHDTTQGWLVYNTENPTGDSGSGVKPTVNLESDTWLPVIGLTTPKEMYDMAKLAVSEFLERTQLVAKGQRAIQSIKNFEDELLTPAPLIVLNDGDQPCHTLADVAEDDSTNIFGETVKAYKVRSRRTKANHVKPEIAEQERASLWLQSEGTRKMFAYKKSLGDEFFGWLRELALDEKARAIIPKGRSDNVVSVERAKELKSKYDMLTAEELMWIKMMGEEIDDINDYLQLTHQSPACDEAPWCDGWDKVAVHSRSKDFWLTDGNMHMYTPHEVSDEVVVRDIVRVNKMIDHCPKEVWESCRYKGRMELPLREQDIGNVYASRAACKAQLLYDYLPGFFNNHKVFFEPCCGFGGFAQFFSHQMRNMDPRTYLVSSMNKSGHAMPNWSLMQASDSNCRVVRVMQDVRDGNICDPAVLAACKDVIRQNRVTLLLFDIGERHSNPTFDDAWYLAPRTVKGGFDHSASGWKTGHSICSAISEMIDVLPDGADGVFKVNTFSMRVTDIIHWLSKSFAKVRALKLATTPEMSREFYLFCSNKKTGWAAPVYRSRRMKDCVRELTWSAMFRAENMYRTKGRHATRPRTYKWFTPDTSGISYKMIPNVKGDRDELDVTTLPNGHAIHISTSTPRGEVKVDLDFEPNWDKRFRCMKDYVQKVNKVSKSRTNRGRDNIKFDNIVRSDFTYVKGIGSFAVRQKNTAEKHAANDLISSYMKDVAGLNMVNATYGHTQGTPEYVKPALKKRLDVQPGQPDPTCVIDFTKAVHCLMSEAGSSMLGSFRFMSKEETYAMIVKTGSTGILDPGSTLHEFMEIYPEWYELAWQHVLEPHTRGAPTPSYQSVRIKPEPKGRKDVEDGRLQFKKGATLDEIRAGNSLSPRFIQFSDALTRIAHIIAFGHVLEYHGKKKLYKGSINGTPPHIQGRVMRAYWDLHNPYKKRVAHVGNNKEMDICIDPTPGYLYNPRDSKIKSLDIEGRLGASIYEEGKTANEYQEDLPAGLTIDFSALDSTVTVSERMIMTDLWKRFFDNGDEKRIIEGLCRDMTYAICLDDAGNIWVRDGQRGSGEILTSIENTWLVTANIVCALSHALGVSIEDLTATQGKIHVLTRPGGCGSPKVNVVEEIRNGAPHKSFEFGDIPLLVDGDDVVIISTRKRINQIETYMNGVHQWLASNRKVIRSGNKGGATKYLEFEGLSFCSHRYEAVFIGPSASKFNPKFLPRSEGGRKLTRGDLLSVAEDNDFKIYFLPIRPVADIMSKLMLTLKVKSLKWDKTKTGPGECVDLTQSKIISYLLLYPQCRWVRYTCLTLLCVTGDNLATFIELRKRYRDLGSMDLKHTSKLLGSMSSLYGVSSLDDISLREYRSDSAEIRKLYHNTRLTFNVTQVTKAAWLHHSFEWLSSQRPTDIYPLMWDSSVFGHYQRFCQHSVDANVSHLRELLHQAGFSGTHDVENNKDGLWSRIQALVG